MRLILAALLITLPACGHAADGKIEGARAGSTVKLSGDQGVLTLKNKTWSPAITVDASAATFTGIVLDSVTGIRFKGGKIIGPGGRSYGMRVLKSRNVTVDGMTITAAHRGIVIDRSQDITVRQTQLTGLISDGIDMAASQRIRIEGNSCSNFSPQLATFDADGKKHDGDHPDCIQGWSVAGQPATSDVTVIGNRADGIMQGVFFRDSKNAGAFERLVIRDNVLRTGLSNAIFVEGSKSAVIENNQVSPVIGSTHIKTGRQVKANIIIRNAIATACGNRLSDFVDHATSVPCRGK